MARKIPLVLGLVFFLFPLAHSTGGTEKDLSTEEIRIFFQCRRPDVAIPESLSVFLDSWQKKLEAEKGRAYFLPFSPLGADSVGDLEKTPPETTAMVFSFRNGSFLWERTHKAVPQSPDPSQYSFQIRYLDEDYSQGQNRSGNGVVFWVLAADRDLPNRFRFHANHHFVSCPQSNQELGSLRLRFRNRQMIGRNLEYISLQNWRGDL